MRMSFNHEENRFHSNILLIISCFLEIIQSSKDKVFTIASSEVASSSRV